MSDYKPRVPGRLLLKGGVGLVERKPQRKRKATANAAAEPAPTAAASDEAAGGAGEAPAVAGIGGAVGQKPTSTYEDLFPLESKRLAEAKGRTAPYGTNYRAPPAVLHGYTAPLDRSAPLSAEARLDLRSAAKADKFCR